MHPGIKPEPVKVKKFPVILKRGYFPADPDHPVDPVTGVKVKVQRGDKIELPRDEAMDLIRRGLAERADDLPL